MQQFNIKLKSLTDSKCYIRKRKCIYKWSSVYDVLDLQRFVVTSPAPINLLTKCCSIIPTYGIQTNFGRELVGGWSGGIRRHTALYAKERKSYVLTLKQWCPVRLQVDRKVSAS